MKKIKPAYIVLGVVAVILAVVVLPRLFASQPGMTSVEGDVITETLGDVDTNASAVYEVTLLEGSDPEHESDHMFEALMGTPGVGEASLNMATLELTVAYDEEVVGDSVIREKLLLSGYVQASLEDAAPTEVAEDGSVQRIDVADTGVQFNPYLIRATAGVPIEFHFAPGQECRTIVKFPDLGVEQDISQGGVVVLEALEPGEYMIACGGDGAEGTLIVE
jgi:hypothetical protein